MNHKPSSQSDHRNWRVSSSDLSDNTRTTPHCFPLNEPRASAHADVRGNGAARSVACRRATVHHASSLSSGSSYRCRKYGTLRQRRKRSSAYILLETVIAVGVLVVGLGVVGAQIQGASNGVRKMERLTQAMMLAEMKLAELDLGLVELKSFDEIEESDFGPRYPDWGWVLITEETGIDQMYSLTLEVLYAKHEDDYKEDSFEHDIADVVYTLHAMRSGPRPLDLGTDFGLDEERFDEVSAQLDDLGIDGLDAASLDPSILAKLDIEDFLEVLPILADAMGIDVSDMLAGLPPEFRSLFEGLTDDNNAPSGEGNGNEAQPGERPSP